MHLNSIGAEHVRLACVDLMQACEQMQKQKYETFLNALFSLIFLSTCAATNFLFKHVPCVSINIRITDSSWPWTGQRLSSLKPRTSCRSLSRYKLNFNSYDSCII
ncbi:hypothetical protein Golob_009872 [Gossypium lobatum]|uniref:Uncharacterized protein n=1 Tax=Gossypium lobatum TaxID=34289 RepID=A0A7J8MK67_9ROSI|nr:hypothetical protein [Gossypium lobatum]